MEFYNYGDVMYIKSEDDYREWIKHTKSKNLIKDVTQRLDEWDNRDSVSFKYRPSFAPIWTREDLKEWIEEFENTKWDFVEPRSMKKDYFEEDGDE
jgi:hypothetical protein